MENFDHLTAEERESLVAYLDGELDEEAARALEAKLNRNATTRREVEALKQTWELLDYLPRPQAPEDFTHRTLEKLDTRELATVRRRRWLRGVSWVAGVVAAGTLSFALVCYWPRPAPPEPSPEDLRVLEHRDYWPYYENIDNIEFLRGLDQADLFGEDS
jgi:anti-sigma factor RsiW